MAEYIERSAVLQNKITMTEYDEGGWDAPVSVVRVEVIEAIPAADVAPVVHGRWIGLEYDGYADGCPVYDLWGCSECGEEVRGEDVPDTHPWCHGCGAKMDAGGGE